MVALAIEGLEGRGVGDIQFNQKIVGDVDRLDKRGGRDVELGQTVILNVEGHKSRASVKV